MSHANFKPLHKWPIILALHGGGEYGSDDIRQTAIGLASTIRRFPDRVPAIVVFPQAHANGEPGWQGTAGRVVLAALDKAIAEFSGDSSRIYLTGYSRGGNGSWHLASRYPDRFADIAVVCGLISEIRGQNSGIFYPSLVSLSERNPFAAVAKQVAHLPIWILHGEVDPKVSVEESRQMFAALKALSSDVQYAKFQGVKHGTWNAAYDCKKLLEWMFKQNKLLSQYSGKF